MPRLGDVFGRKPVFAWCLLGQSLLFGVASFVDSYIILLVSAFLIGPMYVGRLACGFLLLMELVPKKTSSTVGAALMVCQGSVLIYWSIYFVWIGSNAKYMLGLGVILNFVTAILSFFIPESPKYLFGKERFDEARKSLKTIASRNGVSDFKPPIFN
jgi:MFS family permease